MAPASRRRTHNANDAVRKTLAVGLLGIGLAGCAPGNPERDKVQLGVAPGAKFAVMAVVPHEGNIHWGLGQAATEQQAASEALGLCANSRCRVVHTYRPGDCAVVVLGRDQVFWTESNAESAKLALDTCEAATSGCEIKRQLCL